MSTSSSSPWPDLPGHYWDPERHRYFRITRDHPAPVRSKPTKPSSTHALHRPPSSMNFHSKKKTPSHSSFPHSRSLSTLLHDHWRLPLDSFNDTEYSISQQLRLRTLSQGQPLDQVCQQFFTTLLQARKRTCLQYPTPFRNHNPLLAMDASSDMVYWTSGHELFALPFNHLHSMRDHPPQRIREFTSPLSSFYLTPTKDYIMTTLGNATDPGTLYFNTYRRPFPRKSCWTCASSTTQVMVGCTRHLTLLDLSTFRTLDTFHMHSDPLALSVSELESDSLWYVGYRDGTSRMYDARQGLRRGHACHWKAFTHHVSVNGFVHENIHNVYVHARQGSVALLQPGYPWIMVHDARAEHTSVSSSTDAVASLGVAHHPFLTHWILSQPNQQWIHLRDRQVVHIDPAPTVHAMAWIEQERGWLGINAHGFVHLANES
ncbi:hypothetical protein HMI54_002236 [Coelomomyces lativittatus]|nr:hypothetical protein HMI56_003559 [Coelomomyces lativittatus]KAJ1502574.1 hypothetical protein HMI55_002837 [Coelomomyces lativittatus]KAJ1509629.1 hypothetical protein HMI54_002236 [Coelomomyces lativittatus]